MTKVTVLQQKMVPKNKRRGSEDGILVDEHCYAVIDGVSSGVSPTSGSSQVDTQTPGQFAMENGKKALVKACKLAEKPADIVPYLTTELARALETHPVQGTPAYTFVAFVPKFNKIVRVGDCTYLLDGKGKNEGLAVDSFKTKIRVRDLNEMLAQGFAYDALLQEDPTQPRMDFWTKGWQYQYANNDHPQFGYSVINGHKVPDCKVEYFDVPNDTEVILLASDGCPADLLVTDDLESSYRNLLAVLKEDPLCIRKYPGVRPVYAGYEIPDDFSAIRLRIQRD
jgi:hypothetical protein